MPVPKLNIVYSPTLEIERLQYVAGKLDWYQEHGYKPSLPNGWQQAQGIPVTEEISRLVNSEYVESTYDEQKRFLELHWPHVFEQLQESIEDILPGVQDEYFVYLTRYGTGGSYDYPNSIWANITYWWETGLVRDVLHEVVHLVIHPYVEKYNVSHWYKERLVDLITLRISNKYGHAQDIKVDVSMVDDAF